MSFTRHEGYAYALVIAFAFVIVAAINRHPYGVLLTGVGVVAALFWLIRRYGE